MALINNSGYYIKLNSDGTFEMYSSEVDRLKLKAATDSSLILQKYIEILLDLQSEKYAEMRYYDRESWSQQYDSWLSEFNRYDNNLIQHITTETYPLMAEYYPDVADSIPNIILTGTMGQHADTAEQNYDVAKKYKTWGETIDA